MLKIFLITGAGGFLGSGVRYLVQRIAEIYLPVAFPSGTTIINISGSFLIGIIFALGDKTKILTPEMRIFLATGFCGGFTTFSTFSLEAYGLLQDRAYFFLSGYIFISVFFGIFATLAGIWLVRSL